MRRRASFMFGIALLVALGATRGIAAVNNNDDPDNRLIDARVVEVNERHISVVARTGVEHVIAVDRTGTRVRRGNKYVSFAELRKDDIITIDLDEARQIKFAKQIEITHPSGDQVASRPRP